MFGGYEDIQDLEDELYKEESSSEESVDSETECFLYSQVHYAQNLSLVNGEEKESEEEVDDVDTKDGKGLKLHPGNKAKMEVNLINVSDIDCVQISDGPEVITLSDTTEEDSIYKSKGNKKVVTLHSRRKGQQLFPTGQSTPNRANTIVLHILDSTDLDDPSPLKRHPKKCSGKSSSIHEVLVVEESSDEEGECDSNGEDEETSSESDFENWMLLGNEKEDADNSIQLNLEGFETSIKEEGENGAEWSIGDKDLEAQIGNYTPFRRVNRYYTSDKNIICRNCDNRGHLSKNCSVPRKVRTCCLCGTSGHLQNTCPARLCSNCFMPGHFFKDCIEKAHWKKKCHRCSVTGHYADACPEIWRQYHLTVEEGPIRKPRSGSGNKAEVYCYNCSMKGHFGHECAQRRMFQGSFPACPFIFFYDQDYDIWKRDQRLAIKVQELQEAGLLPLEEKHPRSENADGHHSSKRQKKHHNVKRGYKEGQSHKESKKKKWSQTHQEKKHKKARWCYDVDSDFPRGTSSHSRKHSSRSPLRSYDPSLSKHVKRSQANYVVEDGIKKRRKKHKGRRDHSPDTYENLFGIKQRHKKSKKHAD